MIIYSIDIETTGIDPELDQILSIGIVELDTNIGLTGKTLNILFVQERITGTPFAINMNQDLIKIQRDYLMLYHSQKSKFIKEHGFDYAFKYCDYYHKMVNDYPLDNDDPYYDALDDVFTNFVKDSKNVICLGKNFASFDLQFLKRTDIFNEVKLSSRSADIAILYQIPSDKNLPNMKTCMERSNLDFENGVTHDALQDAKDTALLYMEGLKQLKT